MKYDMKRPCPKCPFRRGGPMRLRRGRVVEIAALFDGEHGTQGGTFPCHETLDYDTDDGEAQETEKTLRREPQLRDADDAHR